MVSKGARGASTRASIWNFSASSAASTARSRSGRSGWPAGVKCSRQAGWLMRSVVDIATNVGRAAPLRNPSFAGRYEASAASAAPSTPSPPSTTVRSSAPAPTATVFGEKPRDREARRRIAAETERRQSLLRQQAAAGGDAEQPQIGAGAGQRCVGLLLDFRQEPVRRPRQAFDRIGKPHRRPAEGRVIAGVQRRDDAAQVLAMRRDGGAVASGSLRVTRSIAWMPLVPS